MFLAANQNQYAHRKFQRLRAEKSVDQKVANLVQFVDSCATFAIFMEFSLSFSGSKKYKEKHRMETNAIKKKESKKR
uniref:Uncharacterized protein n=1 Tax=Romanomermis culicivorax TaxID=13658 RepID=A0A915HYC7_ROMCU